MHPERTRLNVRVSTHEDAGMAELMAAPIGQQIARFEQWGLPPFGLLILMSACQGRCFFCASPAVTAPGPDIVTPPQAVDGWLAGNLQYGVEDLCLGGTEPMTHPYFAETLRRAREVGFRRVQLMTSGLGLADEGVAETWKQSGIESVCIPIYGAEARTHDAVVGVPGQFERVLRGVENARAVGLQVFVHTLALVRNLGELAKLAEWVEAHGSAPLAVAPLREKAELFSYREEAVTFDELAQALCGSRVSLVGFPRCVAPHLPRGAARLIELYFRSQLTVHAAPCADCVLKAECPGVVAAHHALFGAAGLSATRPEGETEP